jgi:hypothetical protein
MREKGHLSAAEEAKDASRGAQRKPQHARGGEGGLSRSGGEAGAGAPSAVGRANSASAGPEDGGKSVHGANSEETVAAATASEETATAARAAEASSTAATASSTAATASATDATAGASAEFATTTGVDGDGNLGSQFTCFTGTKVQILTLTATAI